MIPPMRKRAQKNRNDRSGNLISFQDKKFKREEKKKAVSAP